MIFLKNADGRPMMPTNRAGHIRRLLANRQATVVTRSPFVIRLAQQTDAACEPLILGIDPGMTIGFAVIKESGEPVLIGELETRSADISDLMAERRMHRMARHRYRRIRRQRRARRAGTVFAGEREFPLSGTNDDGDPLGALTCKFIRPKVARFANRGRSEKWMTPTARHLRDAHLRLADYLATILPISRVVLEYASFDTHLLTLKLDNPDATLTGEEYQFGLLYGAENARQYALERDGHLCQLCKKKSEHRLHVHHLWWQKNNGADHPSNLITLCLPCHDKVHTNPATNQKLLEIAPGRVKRLVKTTLVNSVMPFIYKGYQFTWPTRRTYGYVTKHVRKDRKLPKAHTIDAYLIALRGAPQGTVWPGVDTFPVLRGKQYRRHNRQELTRQPDRKYYVGKTCIAKNRAKREAQHDDALADVLPTLTDAQVSTLRVIRAKHVKKSDFTAIQRGDTVRYNGKSYTVRGFCSNGKSLYFEGEGKAVFPTKQAVRLCQNPGIVWSVQEATYDSEKTDHRKTHTGTDDAGASGSRLSADGPAARGGVDNADL